MSHCGYSAIKREQGRIGWRVAVLAFAALLLAACGPRAQAEVVASGLNQPRGMTFDAAGNLLVAEAGAADPATVVGPVATNSSGRVVRVTPGGGVSTVLEGLPFTRDVASGTDVGPADVLEIGGALYVLTAEGHLPLSRSLLRVEGGQPRLVASFLAFAQRDNLFAKMVGGAGVQANPFAMARALGGGDLFVSDGASGRVLRVTLDGAISVFAEVPQMPPLTGLTFGPDGRLYISVFSVLPHTPGTGAIVAADGSGALADVARGLTMPIDVAFDAAGAMYVLEFGDGRSAREPYAGASGRLLRFGAGGERVVVLDRLDHPTAMLFGPGGDLYLTTGGAISAAGAGAVLRVRCADLGGVACGS